MNCKLSEDYMMKYFDGDLNDIETAKLMQHFKTCAGCQADFDLQLEVYQTLEREDAVEPSPDFEQKVMMKLKNLEQPGKHRVGRLLIYMYSMYATLLTGVIFVLILNAYQIPLLPAAANRIEALLSWSYGGVETVHHTMSIAWGVVLRLTKAFLQSAIIILKTYDYVFATLVLMFFIMQKMLLDLIRQGSEGTR